MDTYTYTCIHKHTSIDICTHTYRHAHTYKLQK